jgi:methylated-DNA-[protein]-cysteine S-methyltransferase
MNTADAFQLALETPIGRITVTGSASAITRVDFDADALPEQDPALVPDVVRDCVQQLAEYFEGRRREFSVRLDPPGTPFQQRVWHALLAIPFGQTTTYGALASELGDPKTIRAVGRANGQNPIAIIVPCHRVIGSDGSLVGYGGGLWRKRWLLEHEGRAAQLPLFPLD